MTQVKVHGSKEERLERASVYAGPPVQPQGPFTRAGAALVAAGRHAFAPSANTQRAVRSLSMSTTESKKLSFT